MMFGKSSFGDIDSIVSIIIGLPISKTQTTQTGKRSAAHQTPQAKTDIPYQPLLIKPVQLTRLRRKEKQFFQN